jgi:hypothetical protein
MAAETHDLFIAEIDPRGFLDQFTPGDAAVAFSESYSLWAKLRAPFVRWVAVEPVESVAVTGPTPVELAPAAIIEAFPTVEEAPVLASPVPASSAARWLDDTESEIPVSALQEVCEVAGITWEALAPPTSRPLVERVEEGLIHLKDEAALALETVRDAETDLVAQVERAWKVPMLVPRLDLVRVMAGFFALLVVVSLPAGAVTLSRSFGASVQHVVGTGRTALAQAETALQKTGDAQTEGLKQASQTFRSADQALTQSNALALALAQAIPETRRKYQTARALLKAGERSSEAGQLLTQGVSRAFNEPAVKPDERLLLLATYVDQAAPKLSEAADALKDVDPAELPEAERSKVEKLKTVLETGRAAVDDLQRTVRLLVEVIGHSRPRTYLFVFQNHTELRPTGGFMGSLAEVTLDRGEISHMFVPGGGPYDLKGQLLARVRPPQPLQLVDGRWEFQDANWFPDFPASADKIRWFWSKGGQPTLDGVVAINATIMEKVLAITGPIDLPDYGKTISAENFLEETQRQVELDYDKAENKPKKFIGDLMQKMLERVKQGDQVMYLKFLAVLGDSLETKEVQVAFTDPEEEKVVEEFGWSGRLKPTSGDALAVIEANIAGQKTDRVIDESVSHEVTVQPDGSLVDTVTLSRTHNGAKGELFHGANNVAYVRLYAPQGSTLLAAKGFQPPLASFYQKPLDSDPEDADLARLVTQKSGHLPDVDVTDEFGRTAFGGWVQLKPGASSQTSFTYKLPFTVYDLARQVSTDPQAATGRGAYTLLLTSQSGKDRALDVTLRLPPGWTLSWTKGWQQASDGWRFTGTWDRDTVLAAMIEPPHDDQENPAR